MTKIVKVCVRIPADKREDLMMVASEWREAAGRSQGWDAKAIHQIANESFGGLKGLFEHHRWQERGKDMMPSVQRHVVEDFGSVENFVSAYRKK